MAITDELREYANIATDRDIYAGARLCKIADRIDREHRMAMEKVAAEVDALPMTDESMAEHGWVRLPVDADGVPIRIGERVQRIGNDPSTVSHMSLADDGWRVYVKYDGELGTGSGKPKYIRHYHAPTVEDVLDEFFGKANLPDGTQTRAEIIAEYAAKLRLVEEVDE